MGEADQVCLLHARYLSCTKSNLICKELWDRHYNLRLTLLPQLVSGEAGFELSSPSDSATPLGTLHPCLLLRPFTWKQSRRAEGLFTPCLSLFRSTHTVNIFPLITQPSVVSDEVGKVKMSSQERNLPPQVSELWTPSE